MYQIIIKLEFRGHINGHINGGNSLEMIDFYITSRIWIVNISYPVHIDTDEYISP